MLIKKVDAIGFKLVVVANTLRIFWANLKKVGEGCDGLVCEFRADGPEYFEAFDGWMAEWKELR